MKKLILLLMALLGYGWVTGASADDGLPLTLSAAVERATSTNPALQAASLELEVAGGQRDAAALSPATTVGVEVENFAGGGEYSGFDSAETTLLLARQFERGDKASLRRMTGDRRLDLAVINEWSTRIDIESETEQLFYSALASQSDEQWAAEAVAVAEQTLAIVEQRVDIGRSSDAESHTAYIRLTRARLMLEQNRRQSIATRNQLALQWGAADADFAAVAGDLMRIPQIPALAALRDRLDGNPELTRLVSEANLVAAEQQLAAAQAKTDIELSAGVRYLSSSNDAALVFGVNVPFGQGRRAEPLGRAASARLAQAPLETEQRRRELITTISRLHAEIEQRQLALDSIRDEMVPRANDSLELYRQGYERGGYSLLELTEAQNMTLGLRSELIDVAIELHTLRIQLIRLTGGSQAPGAST
jgi:cobalt-zinc-cadmium efflux system outer membrane protein